jgi:hypothetical protein
VHTEQLIAGLYQKEDGELRALMGRAKPDGPKLDGDSLFEILDKQARTTLPRLPDYAPVELLACRRFPSTCGLRFSTRKSRLTKTEHRDQ